MENQRNIYIYICNFYYVRNGLETNLIIVDEINLNNQIAVTVVLYETMEVVHSKCGWNIATPI